MTVNNSFTKWVKKKCANKLFCINILLLYWLVGIGIIGRKWCNLFWTSFCKYWFASYSSRVQYRNSNCMECPKLLMSSVMILSRSVFLIHMQKKQMLAILLIYHPCFVLLAILSILLFHLCTVYTLQKNQGKPLHTYF